MPSYSLNPGNRLLFDGAESELDGINLEAPSTDVNAGLASGTGTAYQATGSITDEHVSVNAGLASGTGTAYQASAFGGTTVLAGLASGTGSAGDITAGDLPVNAGHASGSGAAYVAMPAVDAHPTAGSGTGSAYDAEVPDESITSPGVAQGTGTSFDPEAEVVEYVTPSTISLSTSVPTPGITNTLGWSTVEATVTIPTPAIHVTTDGVATPTTPRWTFYDPETGVTQEFDMNPTTVNLPSREKDIQYQNTLPGLSIIYDAGNNPQTISWSGTILQEAQLGMFETWWNNQNEIELTDDLGVTYTIYITSFAPKRVRKREYPWFHTYTMEATVVS